MKIILATTQQHHAFCVYLRVLVFMQEQGYTLENELEPDEDDAVFFLAMKDGMPVGTVRYRIIDNHIGRIERLAIHPDCRGNGTGKALMKHIIQILDDIESVNQLELIAMDCSVPFHEGFGFTRSDQPHEEAGHKHYLMTKEL